MAYKTVRDIRAKFPIYARMDWDDLRAAAVYGLVAAAAYHDPARGLLSTYVYHNCKWKMKQALWTGPMGLRYTTGRNQICYQPMMEFANKFTRKLRLDRIYDHADNRQEEELSRGERMESKQWVRQRLWEIVDKMLSYREALIVKRRFVNQDTLEELAVQLGITRQRIQQIHDKAMRRLRMLANRDPAAWSRLEAASRLPIEGDD